VTAPTCDAVGCEGDVAQQHASVDGPVVHTLRQQQQQVQVMTGVLVLGVHRYTFPRPPYMTLAAAVVDTSVSGLKFLLQDLCHKRDA
jgi:hypothetical protein